MRAAQQLAKGDVKAAELLFGGWLVVTPAVITAESTVLRAPRQPVMDMPDRVSVRRLLREQQQDDEYQPR